MAKVNLAKILGEDIETFRIIRDMLEDAVQAVLPDAKFNPEQLANHFRTRLKHRYPNGIEIDDEYLGKKE